MRKAFTVVELLIVLAIIVVTVSILLPVFFSARAKARQSACIENIRQFSLSLRLYANDNDGDYPTIKVLQVWNKLHPALAPCPAAVMPRDGLNGNEGVPGYALNSYLMSKSDGDVRDEFPAYPSVTVQVCEQAVGEFIAVAADLCKDGIPTQCTGSTGERGFERHNKGANYVFVDGHTKWYLPSAFPDPIERPGNTSQPRFAF